ncbi:DUF4038 domain-containing protein [Planktothrix sp. FACHB-1365]|uniref:apiosidase-like domain-containing protein n=1 Tax=Planktothrix sp. FACHB-1365 TaxID=2692855 RepID=UPI001683035A|nr:DUF4038 domain-containing protein [Planktothrix sp. FACHB-1365]MBD2483188.1 DUF4038 domain-containing protein [Planktothrix sp. FACHB-1365]
MRNFLKFYSVCQFVIFNGVLISSILACRPTPEANSQSETRLEPINYTPVVSAGFSQVFPAKKSVQLHGTVTYLGDSTALKTQWQKISGPGNVTFQNAQLPNTTVQFSQPGTYVLKLTAKAGEQSSTDQVTVQVKPVSQAQIPAFSIFEQGFSHSGTYQNPYTEVEAIATLTTPKGETQKIPLFWDGGTTWKLRFSPNLEGIWKWSVQSNDGGLNNKSGSFKTIAAKSKGGIQVNPQYPHHFIYQDGTPFWLLGDTQWTLFNNNPQENLDRNAVKQYIDTRAKQGFNFIHSNVMSLSRNEGGSAFDNISEETLNPGYWQEVDSRIKSLNQNGITSMLFLTWSKDGVSKNDWRAFPNEAARLRYARYIVGRYSAFNVAFTVAGEWNEYGDKSMYEQIAQEILKFDPHQRLIGIHPGELSYSVAEFAEKDWMSFADYQQNYTQLHQRVLDQLKYNKPVVNSEYAYYLRDQNEDGKVDKPNSASLDEIRHSSWDIVMAGGYFITGWGTTYFGGIREPGPFNVNDPKNDDWEAQVQHIPKLFKTLDWWKFKPIDRRIKGEGTHYLLANDDQQFIVYVRDTNKPLSLDLESDTTVSYTLQVYNPRLGQFSDLPNFTGTNAIQLKPPTDEDWIFVLKKINK